MEKASYAQHLKDDLELLKLKNNNLEIAKADAGKAAKEKEEEITTLKAQHKQELKKLENEL